MLLAVSDFSVGEGVYPAELIARLAPRLGYTHVAAWDWGLHGWPRLRSEALAAGLTPILGSRFRWRGLALGALPQSDLGYAELCRMLTDLAHGRPAQPPRQQMVEPAQKFPDEDQRDDLGRVPLALHHPVLRGVHHLTDAFTETVEAAGRQLSRSV